MPRLIVTSSSDQSTTIDAGSGQSVMRAIVDNGVEGIAAECGGTLACATCHAYIAPTWRDRLPARDENEEAMLECAVDPRENSRLTCQIIMSEELDGLEVKLPESQY